MYARTCAQCGKAVWERDRVAAHVTSWAFGCVPLGPTLRTTCKACNHPSNPRRRVWGLKLHVRRLPPSVRGRQCDGPRTKRSKKPTSEC